MGDVQRYFKNVRIRFPEMNNAGADKKINEFSQFEID